MIGHIRGSIGLFLIFYFYMPRQPLVNKELQEQKSSTMQTLSCGRSCHDFEHLKTKLVPK